MEIVWSVGYWGHLHSWSGSSEWPVLVSKTLGVEWTATAWVFGSPVNASWTMSREDVVSVSSHVVDDCVGVNSHVVFSACVDHVSELFWGTHSWPESVAGWLIEPVPWVKFSIFRIAEVQNWFLRWEHFNSQVTCLSKHDAFLGDFIIRPAEHFNDDTFLSVFIIWWSIDSWVVPDEVQWIKL